MLKQRELHLRVSYKDLCNKALTLFADPDFRASRGWVDKFMHRNHFSLRRNTTVGQRLPPDLIPKVESFIKFNASQILNYKLNI